ncbi:hypothetical protein FH609_002500 [Streptomyces sp. 3MP-14]|uniref:Uncharacterized protein n=1 Tax=Streptomyces mimosae TaxID=2586635 RepID=A0A5N6ADY3_9ACTN|nr:MULTISPECIES: hypothetical protein [Streptomyces]KAB8166435.1 hypothetical protein FH607_011450 [Streptomyces mimosae]KAB8178865.1 hypothetical protein FH609_002500 [Streptomyces sp. 3MP-14]
MNDHLLRLRARLVVFLGRLAADDRGYSTEAVILTAALVGVGAGVGLIFSDEIQAAAENINFTNPSAP